KLGVCVVMAAVSLAACGEEQMTGDLTGGGDGLGEAVIELTSVPTAVRCISIGLQRAPTDSPLQTKFSVMANASSANLPMGRLSTGFARFSGIAWDVDCADPTIGTLQPSWQAPSVDTSVALGMTTRV